MKISIEVKVPDLTQGLQETAQFQKKRCKSRPLPLRRCGDGSNAAHMSTRNELPGVESPGKDLTLCMVWHGPGRTVLKRNSAISNQSSPQDMHACTSHYQSCDTRHICILICDTLLPCQAILCTRTIVLGKPGNTRIDIRGHARENSSQNGVSSLRRSPGP